ncbi:MAG: cytochrome c [Actinomycetota bacterium]|nr:cytochrome c [Actinomycetota bacterium]
MTHSTPLSAATRRRRRQLRRKVSRIFALLATLVVTGGVYAAMAPGSAAEDSGDSTAVEAGRELYEQSCITCHGTNLEGVTDRGPSLIGVGEASVFFQVSTGRMPLARQGEQAYRKPPLFNDEEIDQLMAYIQANGGGPTLPSGDLRDGDLAEGGELFRLNCASCHNFAGRGGALSSGKNAPNLSEASDLQMYAAMLTGPSNMPVFGDNQLTPEQKRAIINYVQTIDNSTDPGGLGIGRAGPVPEGVVIWLGGMSVLLMGIFWIGSKA